MAKVSLGELFDIDVLQQIQDAFSEYTGLAAIMTDPDGVPITQGSGFTHICNNLTRGSAAGLEKCMKCDRNGAYETLRRGEPFVYKCHAGLCDFAAPIMLGDSVIGCFIGGQAAYDAIDDAKFRATAEELGLDPGEYVKAAHEVIFMDMNNIYKAAQFLFKIAGTISMMAYRSYNLIKQSQRLERDTHVRANYIIDNMMESIKTNMDELMNSSKALDGGASVAEMLEEKCGEIYSSVNETVGFLKASEQSADYEERVYKVQELFDKLEEKLRPEFSGSDVSLLIKVDRALQRALFGNERGISYISEKLALNSLKFTSSGKVEISVSSEIKSYSEILVIKITDTGEGISAERLGDIRNLLEKGEIDMSGRSESAEMGFSVIGMLLKKMNGSIETESEEGKGTSFTVRIPQLAVKGEKI